MLSVSPLRISNYEKEEVISSFSHGADKISDAFSGENFLDDINFDDLFAGMDDGDVLPDLELDPEILAEFSVEGSHVNRPPVTETEDERKQGEESVDDKHESVGTKKSASSDRDRCRKPVPTQVKGAQVKKKVKVDWTPELHRRFVQAVEQLGLDKAVPSRILEVMGVDCLTRHNIASHLQKYRSHRKHLLAREAETASWSQRRLMYGGSRGRSKREISPWVAPTMGFPPPSSLQPFRPLHVWGHPTVDQSLMHVWSKHLTHSHPPLRPPWAPPPPPPPPNPSYWQTPLQQGSKEGWVPNAFAQGNPYFPQPLTTTRVPSPPAPGVPTHTMYKADNSIAISSDPLNSHLFDSHPSKETIDAAIGETLAKPMVPLPLGLKPPSLDSVLVELQRQGISKIPPSSSSSSSSSSH